MEYSTFLKTYVHKMIVFLVVSLYQSTIFYILCTHKSYNIYTFMFFSWNTHIFFIFLNHDYTGMLHKLKTLQVANNSLTFLPESLSNCLVRKILF